MRKRKIKFALELKDGEEARSMEELRAHFDLEKIIGYFQDGKLVEWLDDRFYTDEADEIRKMSEDDQELGKKICEVLGAEYTEVEDAETIAWRKERLDRLKQYTDDPKIIEQVDMVAFDQDDLEDIIREEDTNIIYLCNNRYTLTSGMLKKRNVCYVGVGKKVEITMDNKDVVDFDGLGIEFENIDISGLRVLEKNKVDVVDKVMEKKPITIEKVRKTEEMLRPSWYRKVDFLSEYIFVIMNDDTMLNNTNYINKSARGFLFDKTLEELDCSIFTEDDFLDVSKEIIICVLDNHKYTIVFTNWGIYTMFLDRVRICYSSISGIQMDSYSNSVDVYYDKDKYHRMMLDDMVNPIAVRLFLKIAARLNLFLPVEKDIIQRLNTPLISLKGKTLSEKLNAFYNVGDKRNNDTLSSWKW